MRINVDRLTIRWVREEMFSKCLRVWSRVRFNAFSPKFVFYVGSGLDEGTVYVGNARLEIVAFGLVLAPIVVVLFAGGFTASLLLLRVSVRPGQATHLW